MQNKKGTDLLRWICVPLVAIAGGMVVRYLGSYLGRLVVSGWEAESNVPFIVQLLVYAMATAAFVLAGAFAAPHHRRIVAVVLAVVSTLLSLLTHILSQNHPGSTNYLHFAAETVGATIAVAVVFWKIEPGKHH